MRLIERFSIGVCAPREAVDDQNGVEHGGKVRYKGRRNQDLTGGDGSRSTRRGQAARPRRARGTTDRSSIPKPSAIGCVCVIEVSTRAMPAPLSVTKLTFPKPAPAPGPLVIETVSSTVERSDAKAVAVNISCPDAERVEAHAGDARGGEVHLDRKQSRARPVSYTHLTLPTNREV